MYSDMTVTITVTRRTLAPSPTALVRPGTDAYGSLRQATRTTASSDSTSRMTRRKKQISLPISRSSLESSWVRKYDLTRTRDDAAEADGVAGDVVGDGQARAGREM